jgi:hypothetical protein
MTYTQTDIDYYHDLVDQRDAKIEKLETLVTNLAETLKLWAEAYGHSADLELAKNALKEVE